jgi:hypothetical protein
LRDQLVTGGSEMNGVIGPQALGHNVSILAIGGVTALFIDNRRP